MLITQGPHVKDIAAYWRIKFLHILQEVSGVCKTHNHLHFYEKFGLGVPRSREIALHFQGRQPSRTFPRCFA